MSASYKSPDVSREAYVDRLIVARPPPYGVAGILTSNSLAAVLLADDATSVSSDLCLTRTTQIADLAVGLITASSQDTTVDPFEWS